jgi:hypothetical protein
MKRKYHPFNIWEENKFGLWKMMCGKEKEEMLQKAIKFTGDHLLYGSFMLRAVKEWPISCEHNLSASSMNRQAWIGHAACCIALGCPESITREAWHFLTKEQQDLANLQADNAIKIWEEKYNAEKEIRNRRPPSRIESYSFNF